MQEYEELKSEIDKMINYNSILITGGTGSFGRAFVKHLISSKNSKELLSLVEIVETIRNAKRISTV